jgi:Bacterial low temperature requirement A protein (LtrA)
MVFSLCDVGPAGQIHPGTEQAPHSRHRRREFGTKALSTGQLEQRVAHGGGGREGIRVREISKEEGQRLLRSTSEDRVRAVLHNFNDWLASASDIDDVPYRFATLVEIAGVLVLAVGVPRAFEPFDFSVVVAGCVIMRTALVGQWLRAAVLI